ncbi:MAG: ribosome-associated translation inhibitor RaiA [Bacteroidetes bacterium]|nr:ribosome-associated translation inhibitor RaiA [Bacteroidota bacterium]MBX7045725.1 ribosome-associated translation inhibitor RaiA [Ignavibacteria bacterium]
MKVNFTSRHFKLHETLQEQIKEKLESLERHSFPIIHVDVILYYERAINSIKTCELNVKVKNKVIIAKETSEDFLKSTDKAVERVEAQLVKFFDRRKNGKKSHSIKYAELVEEE